MTAAEHDVVLRVDPVLCEGIGLCARIAGGVVDLDRWGYPVLGPVTPSDAAAARRAVKACPRKALWIEEQAAVSRAPGAGGA